MVAKHPNRGFDVFVSYSSKDKLVADAVVAAHERDGIRCWYAPRDIPPGADWAKSITKAIHETAMMVLVFSGNSNRSQRVLDEINYAISEAKPILPFRIEAVEPSGALRLHLSSRHWLDAYDPSWEAHIGSLVRSVRAILAAGPDVEREGDRGAPVRAVPVSAARKRKPLTALGLGLGAMVVLCHTLDVGDAAELRSADRTSRRGSPPRSDPRMDGDSACSPAFISVPRPVA